MATLKARDQLERVCLQNIQNTFAKIGTCFDMCPEIERLKRTVEDDIDKLERANNNILIKRYVPDDKKYDPFTHELRPESILQITMNYIVYQYMDLCDERYSDIAHWFHFLSDRLRSIRQDIKLQCLRSCGVVQLVECCVRFHIHCIFQLIGEENADMHKANMNDLADSLQLLFQVYDDLYNTVSIRCSNEAEHRAYNILLKLNEKHITSSVLKGRFSRDPSKEIDFALRAHMALATANYKKWLMLLSEASYMCACIMLCYSTQVHNLKHEPEVSSNASKMPFILCNMPLLVGNKRVTSVAQAVCGANLYDYVPADISTRKLYTSFDNDG